MAVKSGSGSIALQKNHLCFIFHYLYISFPFLTWFFGSILFQIRLKNYEKWCPYFPIIFRDFRVKNVYPLFYEINRARTTFSIMNQFLSNFLKFFS